MPFQLSLLAQIFLIPLFLLPPPDAVVEGYASAYAEGVMESVVRYRLDNDVWRVPPPRDWYTAHGYIAAMDCNHVGKMATLVVMRREYHVLVADCAGDDGPPDRFEKMGVVAELDWRLWARLTAEHGRPLPITVRYE